MKYKKKKYVSKKFKKDLIGDLRRTFKNMKKKKVRKIGNWYP